MLEMWRLRASLMPLCVCVCRPGESIKKQLASLSLARSMLSVCVCVCVPINTSSVLTLTTSPLPSSSLSPVIR